MAMDPRKRQKKLERRKAKQRAERRALARRLAEPLAVRLRRTSTAPLLHCCMTSTVWEHGIGDVLVSRQLPDGKVAFVVFLVDVYCLGVKNVMMGIAPRSQYERDVYGKLNRQEPLVPIRPEYARKLVENAVLYAGDLGLGPHSDYPTAKLIFGDISAEACTEEFVYGKDGKPFFVAGPFDDRARCDYILRTLEERCGPEGFHYLIPVGGSELVQHGLPQFED